MKRETINAVKGHLQTIASGLVDMAKQHSDLADNLPAGNDQKFHSDLGEKCVKLGGLCVSCHKAMDDGDTEPVVSNLGNRGQGANLDGPAKILAGADLAKAFDELNKVRGALPDIPTAVLRPGMAPLPDTAGVPEEFKKLVET